MKLFVWVFLYRFFATLLLLVVCYIVVDLLSNVCLCYIAVCYFTVALFQYG